ncbi:hypothetical protein K9L97_00515 [Candidatus Woesearchaeota archaeon]|nr:hypothetical protein [Candidatus Woesearchaeota archaeon]
METALFKKLGLTDAEIKVYLSTIKIGSTTVGPIIDDAKVSRSKIYHVLSKLHDKGLITSITKGKTKYFNAADPKKIQDYIEYKKKELNTLESDAQKIISQLEIIQSFSGQRDEAELYKGIEGVKTARDISLKELKKGDIIRVFGSDKIAQDAMPGYWEEYHKKRVNLGIKGKYLMKLNSKKELDHIKRKPGLMKIKYLPVTSPVYIDIFSDYIITTVMKKGYYAAFLIKNQEIAKFYVEWFDKLWEDGTY